MTKDARQAKRLRLAMDRVRVAERYLRQARTALQRAIDEAMQPHTESATTAQVGSTRDANV